MDGAGSVQRSARDHAEFFGIGRVHVTSRAVLVTGASGAIGGEIAAREAEAGATVAVHGRTLPSAEAAVARLRARVPAGTCIPAPADFLAEGAIAAMIEAIDRDCGRLDAVINCAVSAPAGITGLFRDTDPKRYGELAFHAIATLQILCHASLPLLARQGGAIIAVASDAGLFAAPRQSLIGPTRAAIMNFTRNLALEIARDGVRMNCISLTFVEGTPIFDRLVATGNRRPETARARAGLGLPRPDDVAALALFLAGPAAKRITGQVISINGGLNA
jgi:3-oxoacyl-[acyl-carrier protein] reductase